MAKRFGRNQRRKLIAEIEAQNKEAKRLRMDKATAVRRSRDAQAQMQEVVERLVLAFGPQTALLPIERIEMVTDMMTGNIMRVPARALSGVTPYISDDEMNQVVHVIDVLRLIADVEENHSGEMIIRFGTKDDGGPYAAYCIQRETLHRMGIMGSDIDYISKMVARKLVEHVNKGDRRG